MDITPGLCQTSSTQNNEIAEVLEYVEALRKLHEELQAEIKEAQMAQAEQANKTRHPDPVLKPGDKVLLCQKNIQTTRHSNKLDHKHTGPYTILENVSSHAYKLDLPAMVKIHPVFHISLLKSTARTKPIPGHHQLPLPPVVIQEQQEWEVEKIFDSQRHRNQIQYQVKWTDFYNPNRTWYPAWNFENSHDLVYQFHKEYLEKLAPEN